MSIAIALILAAATSDPASDEPQDEIVVTSRLGASVARSTQRIEDLEKEELERRSNLADALESLAEIHVQAPGGRAGQASLFLRGADPNFTTVLFEGVPLNNPVNVRGGAVNASEMNAGALDKVEVATGALSGVFGGGALAGVVTLTAPGGTAEPTARVSASLATDAERSILGQWRGPLGRGQGTSVTFSLDDDGSPIDDTLFVARSVTLKVAPLTAAATGTRGAIRLTDIETEAFPESSGGPLVGSSNDLEKRRAKEAVASIELPVISGARSSLRLIGQGFWRSDRVNSPGVAPSDFDPVGIPGGGDKSTYKRFAAQVIGRHSKGLWSVAGGVEVSREQGRSNGFLDFGGFQVPTQFSNGRTTASTFLEVGRQARPSGIEVGFRADRIQGMGTRLTGRVGMRLNILDGLTLRTSVGTGFKPPSFYALGNPFVGNPDLKSERSRTLEASLDWDLAGGELSLSAHKSRYRNLIDFVPGPPPRLENRGTVEAKGASLSFTHRLSNRVRVRLEGQFVDTRDADTGERLLNRPRWRSTGRIDWQPRAQLSIEGRMSFVGARRDYAVPTGVRRLDPYATFSVSSAWRPRGRTALVLTIENALAADYEAAVGIAGAARSARLQLIQDF